MPSESKANILLVDDQPASLQALRAVLDDLGHNLVEARSGAEAIQRLQETDFAVVLLAVQMPGLDGFETAKQIRAGEESRHTPILFLSDVENDRFQFEQAYSLGVVDYLVKPLVPVIVRAKVAGFVDLFEKTRRERQQAERVLIAERREFEGRLAEENARLREQREWLRVTLASIGDAVATTDTEGRVTFLNSVAQALTGWTDDDARGQPLEMVFNILHEQTRQPVENPVAKVLWDGVIVGLGNHTVLVARDGSEKPIDDSAAPIRDADGKTVGVVLVFRDVSEQRQAQTALRESEARKTAILETALDCIITMDHEGKVVEFNPAAEKTFGYQRAQVIGHELADLIIPPSLRERHRHGMEHYLATGEAPVLNQRLELPALRADGSEFPVELAITRIPTDGPPLFTAYLRDISERTRLEHRRNARLAVTQLLAQAATVREAATGILQAVCENLGWDVGFFWTRTPDAETLHCLESWHNPGVTVHEFEALSRGHTWPKGEGLPGRIWASGKPAWIRDVLHDDNFPRVAVAAREGLHGAFGCPIAFGGETRGVIEFFSREIRQPDADLLEMMDTVAGQIGQFIEGTQAEEQLRRSEQELADFFENATVGLHWVGADGIILRTNQAELELLGYSREEYVGRPIADFHADEAVICDILKRLQAGEKLNEYPARLRCKDGTIKDVLIDSSVMWEDGRFSHTRCFTRDVTERKRAEEEVHFQARLLDAVGQAAIVTDPDGTIIYWNRFAETLYGWSRSEALGRNVIETTAAPASQLHGAEIMSRLRAGQSWSGEFLMRSRDGTTFPAFVTDTPVFDEQGSLKAIIGISADVTDRKRVEQALQFLADASATLAAIVDYQSTLQKVAGLAVPHFADWCAVDMAEPDGSVKRLAVVHVDQAKVQLALEFQRRYPPDPDSPHGVPHVLRSGVAEMMTDIPDALLVQGAKDEEHLRILRELGLRSFMCVPLKGRGKVLGAVSFILAESGRRYTKADLAFAEELARRAAIAIENSQLYAELRDADRRKDEFLATLAHELRNPLAPLRNSLQILKMPRVDAATAQRTTEMMERQVQHLVRLVDDLLDVSRVMRGKIELRKERVELASVVARAVETAQPLIEAQGHELTIALPSDSLPLDADSVRLAQVVGNLLTNAAKYTEAKGRLWLTAAREGDRAVLRVRDNGIGIAPDMLPHIFGLFVQVDHAAIRSQGGLGIGLTLVKNLVEMHQGTVKAYSAGLGKGSEFVVQLPLSKVEVERMQEEATPDDSSITLQQSSLKVLVVDDNVDAADSLAMLLRLQGHKVRVAHDGPASLEMAASYQPELVFLDIGMPGMDGYEVARRLRLQPGLENIRLLALTGWGQQEDRRRSAEAGFDRHLVKPIEPNVLNKLLAELKRR